MSNIFLLLVLVLLSTPSWGANEQAQYFTFEGRALDNTGTNPLNETVDFILGIYSPGNCLIYEERQNGINLTSSNGYFNLTVGSAVGAGKRTGNDVANDFTRIFSNGATTGTINGSSCSYIPAVGDARLLKVTMVHPGPTNESLGTMTISSTGASLVAETLQGISPSQFMQSWTTATRPTASVPRVIPTGTTGFNSTTGQIEQWNGSVWNSLGIGIADATASSKGVMQVGSGLNVTGGVVSVNVGTAAGTVAAGNDSRFGDAQTLQTRAVSATAPTTGQALVWSGSNWAPATIGAGTVTSVTAAAPLNSSGGATPNITIAQATGAVNGYLSSTDWNTFNSKQNALGFTPVNKAGDTMTGALSMGTNKITGVVDPTAAQEAATKAYVDTTSTNAVALKVSKSGDTMTGTLVLPSLQMTGGTPGAGKVLTSDATGNASWTTPSGGVSTVTATAPIVSSGGANPNISLAQATGAVAGYLTAADWNTFNSKESAITAGTTAQYYRGDKTWQTLNTTNVPEGTNLYYTHARAITAPITGFVSGAGTVSATDTVLQAIQKLDGNVNNHTATLTTKLNKAGDIMTGNLEVPSFKMTGGTPAVGKVLTSDATGNASWNTLVASQWTTSGSDIYYNTGKVGVGTNTPTYMFDIQNASGINAFSTTGYVGSASGGNILIRRANGTQGAPSALMSSSLMGAYGWSGYDGLAWSSSAAEITAMTSENWSSTGHGTVLKFSTTSVGTTTQAERMRIDSAGNVGIGNSAPTQALDVNGYVKANRFMSGTASYALPATDGTAGQVLSTNANGTTSWISAGGGGVTAVNASLPLSSSGGATPTISISAANNTTNGYLTSTDWSTFNGKVGSVSFSMPAEFTTSSNVTAGVATFGANWTTQGAGTIFAAPGGGGVPTFRAMTVSDLPGSVITGGGSANYLPKFSTSNTITASTIYESAGNIGLGTMSPTQKLDVSGWVRAAKFSTNGSNGFSLPSTYPAPATVGARALIASDNTGNIDWPTGAASDHYSALSKKIMDVANPTSAQDVATRDYVLTQVPNLAVSKTGDTMTGDLRINYSGGDSIFGSVNTIHTFIKNNSAGEIRLNTNSIDRFVVLPNGNVGIGTSTPGVMLEVNGYVKANRFMSSVLGTSNEAFGAGALNANTTGSFNTGVGNGSLNFNTTGSTNTAIGYKALSSNTTSIDSTAIGANALWQATGGSNTAVGSDALKGVSTGYQNTALGYSAGPNLAGPTFFSGFNNVFVGDNSNTTQTSIQYSTAIGSGAGVNDNNVVAIGNGANIGVGASNSVAIGKNANISNGSNNSIAIGYNSLVSASSPNSMAIGSGVTVSIPNTIAIGNGTIKLGINKNNPSAELDVKGHIASSQNGTATYISCPGGTISSTNLTDTRGVFSLSSGTPSNCTITFGVAYASVPICVISISGGSAIYINAASSNTAQLVLNGSFSSGNNYYYICMQ